MKAELLTASEAERLGLTHSRLLSEGHGAFGEPDNSYEEVVYIGSETERLSESSVIITVDGKVIQVISEWTCSDKLLEILNPKVLEERKKKKYKKYLDLKKEIESDDFYKPTPTSLDGCPFNYCDSDPKCDGKCRYK